MNTFNLPRFVLCLSLFAFFSSFILPPSSFAQIPRTISYQGMLLDGTGKPTPDGNYTLTLSIYDGSNALLFSEQQTVPVVKGIFNVIIGSASPSGLPATLLFDRQYFLGVSMNGGTEMLPHTPLTSSPYAFRAAVADALAPGVRVVTTINNTSGAIRLVSGGGTTINVGGDSILISSSGGSGTGIQGVESSDGTISVTSPNGPVAKLSIASSGATTGQVLTWNGAKWIPATQLNNAATVTANAPITGNGSAGNPLTIAAANGSTNGYLNSNDWNTFNTKLSSVTVIAPITGNGTVANPLTMSAANGTTSGYMTSTDWTTFNNKLSTVAVTARLTGSGTAANPLDIAQQGATNGQVLTWNGTSWAPANAVGGGGGGWNLTGNTGNTATHYLGTTDGQPIIMKTNAVERARILSSGELGVNTSSPNTKLDIAGDIALRENAVALPNGVTNNLAIGNYSFITVNPAGNRTITGISGGVDGRIVVMCNLSANAITFNHNDNGSVAASRILCENGNNITIGTNAGYGCVTMIYSTSAANNVGAWMIVSKN